MNCDPQAHGLGVMAAPGSLASWFGFFPPASRAKQLAVESDTSRRPSGAPIEKLDLIARSKPADSELGGHLTLAGQDIKIAGHFALHGGESLGIGRQSQSRVTVDVARYRMDLVKIGKGEIANLTAGEIWPFLLIGDIKAVAARATNSVRRMILSAKRMSCIFAVLTSNRRTPPIASLRLNAGMGNGFAVGRPTQEARHAVQRRSSVEDFFIAAVEVGAEQAIFPGFGIIGGVGRALAIRGKSESSIRVVDDGLWRASEDRGAIEVEIAGDGVLGLAEINVVSVG